MRTDNGKVKQIIVSIYFILIVMAVLLSTVFSKFSHLTSNPVLSFFVILAVLLVLFLGVYLIAKYFEYDSDGVKVVVTNRGLLLSEKLNYREHQIEFDKADLKAFKFKNYIVYKTLVLFIKSSSGRVNKEVFNVTLVNRKKRKYIRQSLSKMVKNNLQNKV
ncbi:hypothetical protein [Formosa sp. S-31]|uniref:hypothetical protein n=1 Tax=Formosa sp. S-31 TaxID=2790949 RepID=UPI003EBE7072